MALGTYKKKRDFKISPEPTGGNPPADTLAFVIQKHSASNLHYDFRLEMEGVLKSWAVPKGPSMDPAVNRLAMMVEDHPFDYRKFEGTIPEGNYGAGQVIVWDEGNYAPIDTAFTSKDAADRQLRRALHQGKIKFVLNGHKLKGEFILIKTSTRGKNAWLLKKIKDAYAQTDDILLEERSVLSDKVIIERNGSSKNVRSKISAEEESKIKKVKPINKSTTTKVKTMAKTASKTLAKKTAKKVMANTSFQTSEEINGQLRELFHDQIKDIYWAEKHLTKALPKMQKAATSPELADAFATHLKQTEEQIVRLEKVFELLEEKAQAKKCDAMEGLIEESKSIIEDTEDGTATRDVGLIIAAQKVEHYEIASYGSLKQLATTLELTEIADLLEQTLAEEKETDELLTSIAENNVNYEAAEEPAA